MINFSDFIVQENPSAAEIAVHAAQLWHFSSHVTKPDFFDTDGKVSILVHDETGRPVGGVLAQVKMKVLHGEAFWVSPECRGGGLGTKLYFRLLEYGKSKGCSHFLTYSYEFNGFLKMAAKVDPATKVIASVENCPPPHTIYFFKREL